MLLLCEEAGLELEEDVLLHIYLFLVAKAQIKALILDYAAISGIDMLDITLILWFGILREYALTIVLNFDILAVLDRHGMLRFQIIKVIIVDSNVLAVHRLVYDVLVTLAVVEAILFIFGLILYLFLRFEQFYYFG